MADSDIVLLVSFHGVWGLAYGGLCYVLGSRILSFFQVSGGESILLLKSLGKVLLVVRQHVCVLAPNIVLTLYEHRK